MKNTIPFQNRQVQTPGEDLRTTLDRLDSALGKLEHAGQDRPVEILKLLDHAATLLQTLSAAGADLSPEQGRFETATKQFRKKGKTFLKQMGGASALQALRAEQVPPAEAWWWYLDQQLVAESHVERKHTLRRLAVVAAVLVILSALYALFLAPDEATRLRYRHEQTAESALGEGDLTQALAEAEQALSHAPGDGDLLVLKGAILDLLGDTEAAERAYREAEGAFGNPEQLLAARVEVFLLAAQPEHALEDAQQMVALYPDSAVGFLLLGNADAALGRLQDASEHYTKASELASAAGQADLEGMARVQLANLTLMQSAPQLPAPEPSGP